MSHDPNGPILHIGVCPFCEQGQAKIRTCSDPSGNHFYAVCDECEAIWRQPDLHGSDQFANSESPLCPICQQAMYGEQSHWSTSDELCDSIWLPHARPAHDIDPPTDPVSAAPTSKSESNGSDKSTPTPNKPHVEGMCPEDEPRPGC